MEQSEMTQAHLHSFMGVEFGTRAKVKDGKSVIELDWDGFKEIVMKFYEQGKQDAKDNL